MGIIKNSGLAIILPIFWQLRNKTCGKTGGLKGIWQ